MGGTNRLPVTLSFEITRADGRCIDQVLEPIVQSTGKTIIELGVNAQIEENCSDIPGQTTIALIGDLRSLFSLREQLDRAGIPAGNIA
jgi:hypothetical protein